MTNDQRFENIEKLLKENTQRLDALESKIDKNSEGIEQNRVGIEQNRVGIERNRVGIEKNHASIEGNRELLSVIIKMLDQFHEEQARHREILVENSRSDLRAVLDHSKGNRDRIDDHEKRIERLESAS